MRHSIHIFNPLSAFGRPLLPLLLLAALPGFARADGPSTLPAITTPTTRPAAPLPVILPVAPVSVSAAPLAVSVSVAPATSKLVTNIWVDSDIRQVIQDISSQTGIVIVCDQTVQGAVSMSVKSMSVDDTLERVCAVGGYSFAKVKDYYVVGKAEPGTTMFDRVADPVRVRLAHILPEQVRGLLLPSMLPYVTFDKSSGSVVVTAPEALRDRILDTIKQVDQPNPQVAIEAIVFELSETGSKQLAIDWQFKSPTLSITSQNLVNTITYGPASDIGTSVGLTLKAIVENGTGQVLANPKILVMNNTEGEIFVGQEKYYTLLSGQASNPYYTLQPIKAGITLRVAPSIGRDGQITLKLEPEVSDVSDDTSTTGAGQTAAATVANPLVTRRHASTVVDIKDGQTLLIGGLIFDQHRKTIDKTPLAGDIPGIGAAFRHISEDKTRQEVVIMMSVHIVQEARSVTSNVSSRLVQRYVTPMDSIARSAGDKQ